MAKLQTEVKGRASLRRGTEKTSELQARLRPPGIRRAHHAHTGRTGATGITTSIISIISVAKISRAPASRPPNQEHPLSKLLVIVGSTRPGRAADLVLPWLTE